MQAQKNIKLRSHLRRLTLISKTTIKILKILMSNKSKFTKNRVKNKSKNQNKSKSKSRNRSKNRNRNKSQKRNRNRRKSRRIKHKRKRQMKRRIRSIPTTSLINRF